MTSRRQSQNGGKIKTGGYEFKVKDLTNEIYQCKICTHLIRTYIELPCTEFHGFCKNCLIDLERQTMERNDNSGERVKYFCKICGEEYDPANVSKMFFCTSG
eukprot:TCONS_00052387-protein